MCCPCPYTCILSVIVCHFEMPPFFYDHYYYHLTYVGRSLIHTQLLLIVCTAATSDSCIQ